MSVATQSYIAAVIYSIPVNPKSLVQVRDQLVAERLRHLGDEAAQAGELVPRSLLASAAVKPETASGSCQTGDTSEVRLPLRLRVCVCVCVCVSE